MLQVRLPELLRSTRRYAAVRADRIQPEDSRESELLREKPQPCAERHLYQQRQHWTAPRKGRRPCAVLLCPVAGVLLSSAGFGAPLLCAIHVRNRVSPSSVSPVLYGCI